jgi:hypothetical protein
MAQGPGIDRARRSLLKAAGIAAAAVVAATAHRKPAEAQFLSPAPADAPTFKEDSAVTSKDDVVSKDDTSGSSKDGTVTKETTATTISDTSTTRDTSNTKVCFRRGTMILTADGYRPIETLAVGERVRARFGGLSPIEAIGSFTLARTGPNGTWAGASRPVRIKAGALGESCPTRDLCLTASHAVFTDGVLVPAVNLVNGTSIVFDSADDSETLDFFHVALARHDVLDAHGAACESWRDAATEAPCVPMLGFHGGRDELRSRLRSAASILVDRRQPLDVIRDRLEERGIELARAA